MSDPRFRATDPRSRERADNAGFSIVIALGGFLALCIMAVAMSEDSASERTAETTVMTRQVIP